MVVLSTECFCHHFFIQVSSWRKVCLSTKTCFDRFVQSLITGHFKGRERTGHNIASDVLSDKPHPRFGTKFTVKKVQLIRQCLRYYYWSQKLPCQLLLYFNFVRHILPFKVTLCALSCNSKINCSFVGAII